MPVFLQPATPERIVLAPCDGLPQAVHVFEDQTVDAVNTALAAERPLLVRGEPGVGKTQLARAVAQELGRAFLTKVIDARTEAHDLLWHFDPVARLAKAQMLGAVGVTDSEALRRALDARRFLAPGPLWWAFDWGSAKIQADSLEDVEVERPFAPADWTPEHGCVVLLDEIDKADSAVPNGLLEALGHSRFATPGSGAVAAKGEKPLVIVTTNEERALPDAFLRRCLVLPLSLPAERDALIQWLEKRGQAHFPDCTERVRLRAAELLCDDRAVMQARGLVAPGQAEYLDLLRAVSILAPAHDQHPLSLLERVARYALKKHPDEEVEL